MPTTMSFQLGREAGKNWNKMVLVIVMFTGRLGPLTIAYAVSSRQHTYKYRYAEDRVMIC